MTSIALQVVLSEVTKIPKAGLTAIGDDVTTM
jgi:hypothetical protein